MGASDFAVSGDYSYESHLPPQAYAGRSSTRLGEFFVGRLLLRSLGIDWRMPGRKLTLG